MDTEASKVWLEANEHWPASLGALVAVGTPLCGVLLAQHMSMADMARRRSRKPSMETTKEKNRDHARDGCRVRLFPRSPLLRHAYFVARSQTPRNCCVRFVAAVAVGSRNTHYRAARYGLTRTGLSPVGLRQLLLAPSSR
jgi:hypothetical protein